MSTHLGGKFLDIPLKRERPISLGQTEPGAAIHIPTARLVGLNLGVFGNSATGKSWMVGLIAEGLHHEDYQVILIDPGSPASLIISHLREVHARCRVDLTIDALWGAQKRCRGMKGLKRLRSH